MSEEPWLKPQQSYYHRRIDQHRKWYERHFDELSPGARIVISELLHLNEQADKVIGDLTRQLATKESANPDALHDSIQDGTRLELRSEKHYRRRRMEWEGQ